MSGHDRMMRHGSCEPGQTKQEKIEDEEERE
jgi:hypothetical protein